MTDVGWGDGSSEEARPLDSAKLVEFTDRQLTIMEALGKRGDNFDYAAMFRGALLTQRQVDNPLRFALAAHGIRELMEKLPSSFDVPDGERASLKVQVRELHDSWKRVLSNSQCKSENWWAGEADGPLRKMLMKLHVFFERFAAEHPTRSEEIDEFFLKADPKGHPLPKEIRRDRNKRWGQLRDYFVAVSHQRKGGEEFETRLGLFEDFLIDVLVPETTKDRAAIDALIARGERR